MVFGDAFMRTEPVKWNILHKGQGKDDIIMNPGAVKFRFVVA